MNIGNPEEFTLLELAQTVIELTGSDRARSCYEALPVNDPQQRRPDITRARELLGWEPRIDAATTACSCCSSARSREQLVGRMVGA